ncbi:ATP-grasp fold amidoligase family protein [Sphingomonas prati]|uniref:Polysaccharide biosynthesis protein n=1 Tax=Sphingomonas prati TaxID=1843237 RepID=A0A7W9BV16_9SPHN|nr:ATP-grasp fold amidoligase family protein [Sphingomonas prati]MBB5730541.1 hypothetical protein [Sphingomonas prati]GGE94832.1 hypothetical protein GCM10011404_29900 [Sphingomonas prati]
MQGFNQLGSVDDRAARLRIGLTYLWRHGRLPNLTDPGLFSELVQVRKLREHDPRMPVLADKVGVKAIVASRLGREWVVPLLWSGSELPAQFPATGRVVVKARHGCNQNAFVGDGRDWAKARSRSAKWMSGAYGWWLDEWLYAHIPSGLLVEPFIGGGSDLPVDYKLFVFGGRVTHVQVHLDRARRHRWIVYDRDWCPIANDVPIMPRPTALAAMIAAAEELSTGFDFVRVDFYQPGEQPLFGEISFYPGSGLEPFDPPELDRAFGRLWLEARASQPDIIPVAKPAWSARCP